MYFTRYNPETQQYHPVEGQFSLRTHNGRVTITSPTGQHRTVWIRTQARDAKFAPGQRIISMYTKGENDNPFSYQGFGFVRSDGSIALWNRTSGVAIYIRLANLLQNLEQAVGMGYTFKLEGRCRICNRVLTNPESIDRGIGPECAANFDAQNSSWPKGLRDEDLACTQP